MLKPPLNTSLVNLIDVTEDNAGQRIDNFLLSLLKGVPKSHIYRILRSGEVRRNGGRVGPDDRLEIGDKVRLPPVRIAQRDPGDLEIAARTATGQRMAKQLPIVFEDDALLVVDKPAGMAVHGGSGVSQGVIEALRAARPETKFLELAHRLDRETSGVLILAKRRPALLALHEMFRGDGDDASASESRDIEKRYHALVGGVPRWEKRKVDAALRKFVTRDGERRVAVVDARDHGALASTTIFYRRESFAPARAALVEADLRTGRTHQIRAHLKHVGHPILGDEKYGDDANSLEFAAVYGLKRMFLHATSVSLPHPVTGTRVLLEATLPSALANVLKRLRE